MIKSAFTFIGTKCCKKHFTTRKKVYKFLPAPNKNLSGSKELNLLPATKIDEDTIKTLQNVSLIGIETEKAIQLLEEVIRFADQILEVDTTDVNPLITVLENDGLYLREDVPKNELTRIELFSHSKVANENFFVTPITNPKYISQNQEELIKLKKTCEN